MITKLKLMGFGLEVYLSPDEEALKKAALKRGLEPIIEEVVSKATKSIINKFNTVKADDFTLKRETIEKAAWVAVQRFKERIAGTTIEPKVRDIDRRVKFIPSGIKTVKDYEEYLLRTTGAIKIMELI